MNRTQYRTARRMFRDNGVYSLRWMDVTTRAVFDFLLAQDDDYYAELIWWQRTHKFGGFRSFLRLRYRNIKVLRSA